MDHSLLVDIIGCYEVEMKHVRVMGLLLIDSESKKNHDRQLLKKEQMGVSMLVLVAENPSCFFGRVGSMKPPALIP